MPRRLATVLLTLALVSASCGGPGASSDSDADAIVGPTVAENVTTTATTSQAPQSTSTTEAVLEHIELVVFGDSFAAKSGWPRQYADMVADEFGVSVSVDGNVCYGGCTTLNRIRASESLRDQIASAEFIVLQPQPGRVVAPLWRSHSSGTCGGEDGLECFRQAEADFRQYVEELFDEVISLSQPGSTIRTMRATGTWAIDSFHPGLRNTAPDQFDAFLENMLALSDHIAEAAADRCILAVDVNAIMSGPDYRQPVSSEHSNDGSHPSEEGSRVIAEALRSLGYEGTAPNSC